MISPPPKKRFWLDWTLEERSYALIIATAVITMSMFIFAIVSVEKRNDAERAAGLKQQEENERLIRANQLLLEALRGVDAQQAADLESFRVRAEDVHLDILDSIAAHDKKRPPPLRSTPRPRPRNSPTPQPSSQPSPTPPPSPTPSPSPTFGCINGTCM